MVKPQSEIKQASCCHLHALPGGMGRETQKSKSEGLCGMTIEQFNRESKSYTWKQSKKLNSFSTSQSGRESLSDKWFKWNNYKFTEVKRKKNQTLNERSRQISKECDACKSEINICTTDARKHKRETLDRYWKGVKKCPVAVPASRMREKFCRMRVIKSEDGKSSNATACR